jgi:hypothetical protein
MARRTQAADVLLALARAAEAVLERGTDLQRVSMYDIYQERIIECDRELRAHLKGFEDGLAGEAPKHTIN